MTYLIKQAEQLEPTIRVSKIQQSMVVAFERTATELIETLNMAQDIHSEFPTIPIETIQLAIRKGSLGEFGYTYKLSTQVVCIWIREHLKRKNQNYNSPIL
jgi:hypothetical protein